MTIYGFIGRYIQNFHFKNHFIGFQDTLVVNHLNHKESLQHFRELNCYTDGSSDMRKECEAGGLTAKMDGWWWGAKPQVEPGFGFRWLLRESQSVQHAKRLLRNCCLINLKAQTA